FYQKVNRRPVTLLLDDVQLLSPYAGRLAARMQAVRENLKNARSSALALGAQEQVEPKIAALARRLQQLEEPATTAAARTERLLDPPRPTTASRELAGAIRVRGNGKNVSLSGPQVEAPWLSDREKLRLINALILSHTGLKDEDFAVLGP